MRQLILFLFIFSGLSAQESFNLEQAVDYAVKNNDDMRMASLDIADANAQITEYKSIGMPQLNGSINYQYYIARPVNPLEDFITPTVYSVLEAEEVAGVDPFVGPPEVFEFTLFQRNNLSANLDASWLLFDGSYLSGLKAARMFKDLTAKAVDVKAEEIRASVTKAYMNVLIAEENKTIIKNNLDILNKTLKETQAFYKEGFVEKLDIDRLELSVDNLNTEYDKINQLISISYELLKFQMNYPQNDEISLSEDLETLVNLLKVDVVDLNEPIDLNKRAQYSQIEMGRDLNELNVERLKKGYLPNIRARANFNETLQRNNLFDNDEFGFIPQASVSLGINVPIYDGAQKKGQIQQAQIELERIDIQKSQFERAVNLEVKTSRLQYINAKKSLESRQRQIEIVQDIYNKTLVKFKEGVGSSLEVTQAESSLFESQANYINALYDLLIAKTDLDIALGNI